MPKLSLIDLNANKRLIALAFPLILANITTPLLGLVDTGILGHMGESHYIAGAAIASLIVTQLYWVCGFLKMSLSGLSAQSLGGGKPTQALQLLSHGIFIGLTLGIFVLLLQSPLLSLGLSLTSPNENVANSVSTYFTVRVWGAPFAIANMALIGWFIGQQKTRVILLLQVMTNIINIVLSFLFVYAFDMDIAGVASATVLSELTLFLVGIVVALKSFNTVHFDRHWVNWSSLRQMMGLNTNILIRNLCLQLCIAFVTVQGARLGEMTAAINAILMQFLTLIALGLDGIANAVEALVGEAKGQLNRQMIKYQTHLGLIWSLIFAIAYALIFALVGNDVIALLTNQIAIREAAYTYHVIIIALPILGHWCFLFDGVFIGLTQAKVMKYSMLFSAAGVFFPLWYLLNACAGSDVTYQNMALWLAFEAFLVARAMSLAYWFYFKLNR